jgi:hypothetical protein
MEMLTEGAGLLILGTQPAHVIQLVELMLRIEEMGISIPVEAAWEVETVGEAYQLYTEQTA